MPQLSFLPPGGQVVKNLRHFQVFAIPSPFHPIRSKSGHLYGCLSPGACDEKNRVGQAIIKRYHLSMPTCTALLMILSVEQREYISIDLMVGRRPPKFGPAAMYVSWHRGIKRINFFQNIALHHRLIRLPLPKSASALNNLTPLTQIHLYSQYNHLASPYLHNVNGGGVSLKACIVIIARSY